MLSPVEIEDTKEQTVASSIDSTKDVYFTKNGKIVCCDIPSFTTRNIAGWGRVKICDIPSGFRPKNTRFFLYPRQYEQNTTGILILADSSGTVEFMNQSSSAADTGTTMATVITWETA